MINVHVLFNCLLMLVAPFRKCIERAVFFLMPGQRFVDLENPLLRPALDEALLDKPTQAIASLRCEVLRMAQIVESMIEPVMVR